MEFKKRFIERSKKGWNLPEKERRTIFWLIIIIISLLLLLFWADRLIGMIRDFGLKGIANDQNVQDFSSVAGKAAEMEEQMSGKLKQLELLKQ